MFSLFSNHQNKNSIQITRIKSLFKSRNFYKENAQYICGFNIYKVKIVDLESLLKKCNYHLLVLLSILFWSLGSIIQLCICYFLEQLVSLLQVLSISCYNSFYVILIVYIYRTSSSLASHF